MIYRRYEKENIEKNYVQIVEIFETNLHPPNFIENEKELNDFLGKDAFKTDMNCSSVTTEREDIEETTDWISATTSKPLKDPTSTFRHPTTSFSTTTFRPPNLDNIFTVKPTRTTTKSTIRPNPKENENPDYTELYNWPRNQPKPNVQVTKHLPTTIKPTLILIKETDVQVTKNQTNPTSTSEKNVVTTTEVVPNNENYDDDDNGTDNEVDDYNEDSYDLADENHHNQLPDDENYSDENDETGKRRKRLNKAQRRRKHIQSTKNLISKNS